MNFALVQSNTSFLGIVLIIKVIVVMNLLNADFVLIAVLLSLKMFPSTLIHKNLIYFSSNRYFYVCLYFPSYTHICTNYSYYHSHFCYYAYVYLIFVPRIFNRCPSFKDVMTNVPSMVVLSSLGDPLRNPSSRSTLSRLIYILHDHLLFSWVCFFSYFYTFFIKSYFEAIKYPKR